MPGLRGPAYKIMKRRLSRLAIILIVLVGATESAHVQSTTRRRSSAIMQAELQRNLAALKAAPDPAYFVGYTVHDTRSTRFAASLGALLRSDQSQTRAASVEVRVGDYTFDNTHPLRGDGSAGPRITRVNLPLTDDGGADPPGALARNRPRLQAVGRSADPRAHQRRREDQEDDPSPDFSREEPQVHTEPRRLHDRYAGNGRSGCAGCRRRSLTIR